jgi:gliding motility-associated-like protein
MKRIFTILFFLYFANAAQAQLVLNEVSQGSAGSEEYFELVVVGTKTCNDSTADIRGWMIDDNNGWVGTGASQGIAGGSLRFANNSNWEKVPYGSVILLYNDGDKNPSIVLPDDPTDANHDYTYVVPASSALIESNGSAPPSANTVSPYTYPTTGYTTGGNWNYVDLNNTEDGVIITSPASNPTPYFSFAYGTALNNHANATVYISSSGAKKVYSLSTAQYNVAAAWTTGTAPGNETPGHANGSANTTWINSMRLSPLALPTPAAIATQPGCISSTASIAVNSPSTGVTYSFDNGNNFQNTNTIGNLTVNTTYHVLVKDNVTGCISSDTAIVINAAPGAPAAPTVSLTQPTCTSPVGTIAITPIAGYTYSIDNINFRSTPMFDNLAAGSYPVIAKNTSGCNSSPFTATITNLILTILPNIGIDGNSDTTITLGDPVTLTGITPVQGTYLWTASPKGSSNTIDTLINYTAAPTATTIYKFTVTTGICNGSAEKTVIVNSSGCPPINIPNAFTPNNDGYNDVWVFSNTTCSEKIEVNVYNRWGSLMYHSDNYKNDWDGRYQNNPVSDATYYYVVSPVYADGRRPVLKGSVTILR